ncbi:hypothetical protein [Streptomyces sp. NPDC057429]|uniref:hypothetical protein n=1 Tax=Streptomyces sp. NPDC057429 TaxID=3346130 RepID=UPI00368F54F9
MSGSGRPGRAGGSFRPFSGALTPAGARIRGNRARLALRTSSDPKPSPAESRSTVPVTGTWTVPAVTHTTRPARAASVPGTITGASRASTGHAVDLDASAREGALGSLSSIAPARGGTDSPRVWPSEVSAACRPQLVLTFGAE